MDSEKVIKGITHHKLGQCDMSGKICPYWVDDDCSKKMLEDVLALLKEREWNVLTKDADGVIHGLPGDDGQYLMTDGEDIWIDDYVDGVEDGIFLDSGRDIREIKAWMYMPKLPK